MLFLASQNQAEFHRIKGQFRWEGTSGGVQSHTLLKVGAALR